MNARNAVRYSCLLLAAACGYYSWSPRLYAQTISPPPLTSADLAWQTLKNFGQPTSPPQTGPKPTKDQLKATFLSQADQLKAFYTQYPTHLSAKEAKQREVTALAFAALNGDSTQDARRQSALAAVRSDSGLSVAQRSEAVAWSGRVAIKRQNLKSAAAVLAAEESLTRTLIQEFPGQTDGYNSLLGIARDSSPERGQVIARDVLAMREAPAKSKTDAQRLLERYALVGKPIAPILQKAGAASLLPSTGGKVTVVYTWNAAAPQSLTRAGRMAVQAPKARFIGVCLDSNLASARQAASTRNAPGDQYYNASGPTNPLATGLAIQEPLAVYLVDRNGVIRDVKGATDFASKVANLEK